MTYREMLLTRYDGQRGILLYDEQDAALIETHTWYLEMDQGGRLYPATTYRDGGRKHYVRAGQLLLGFGPWGYGRVEYLNGNRLDCRRANLRHANQTQILAKRSRAGTASKYKGVTWDKPRGKWRVQFRGRNLGRFDDELAAARVFDAAAWDYWGNPSYLNFPEQHQTSGQQQTSGQDDQAGAADR